MVLSVERIPQVQLWIGSAEGLLVRAKQYVANSVCVHSGCTHCRICKNIERETYHGLSILRPDKSAYTVSCIESTFKRSWLLRDADDPYFFIITSADMLSYASAPSLLKLFEEPAAGYYFILLAERKELILSTIISRCVVSEYEKNAVDGVGEFVELYLVPGKYTLQYWGTIFDKIAPTEYQSLMIFDSIGTALRERYRVAVSHNNSNDIVSVQKLIACLEKKCIKPMPGSVKIFWRSLFLTMKACL
ncbi:MAG: hypothetical protein WC707_00865 [Candidatus Babeliaceae bacterium]|jgi:hypothetical protein